MLHKLTFTLGEAARGGVLPPTSNAANSAREAEFGVRSVLVHQYNDRALDDMETYPFHKRSAHADKIGANPANRSPNFGLSQKASGVGVVQTAITQAPADTQVVAGL